MYQSVLCTASLGSTAAANTGPWRILQEQCGDLAVDRPYLCGIVDAYYEVVCSGETGDRVLQRMGCMTRSPGTTVGKHNKFWVRHIDAISP